MNPTLQKFAYPNRVIREYIHWVVLIRPMQLTLGSAIIAAKSDVTSFGLLQPEEMAELPSIIQRYEAVISARFGAVKFNYLGLMMVDPNPHFHAIPRYPAGVSFSGQLFTDQNFPKSPSLDVINECSPQILEALQRALFLDFLS